ncbi:MAG: NusG domain II-containing protein, partial [Gallionella sp.]
MLQYLKPGDWLFILLGAGCVAWLMLTLWSGDLADQAVIRSGGKIFRVVPLADDQQISVPGPLGISIINIEKHRARISSDPSPRQYCVR